MENLIKKAIVRAMACHEGQVRKGDGKTPYFLHPLEVGIILAHYAISDSTIAAAILHDTIEDGKITLEQINAEFGEEAGDLVSALTENKNIADWVKRKEENIGRLQNNKIAYIIKAVDALVNMRELFAAIKTEGPGVWARFNAPREYKMNYFQKILGDLKGDLPTDLLENYVCALKDLQYSDLVADKSGEIGFRG